MMDAEAVRKLRLEPRSYEELHDAYNRFVAKWERKVEYAKEGYTSKR